MGNPNNLEEFMNSFFKLLKQTPGNDQFLTELRDNYWLPGKDWLIDALPWGEIKKYQIKPIKIYMLSDSMGFLVATFELAPSGVITFSLLKGDGRWYIDWQNRDVWLLSTSQWGTKSEGNIEIRFFETFEEEKVDSIFGEVHELNQWIQAELGSNQEKLVIVFGYDSFEYAISEAGNKPSGGGGSSRGKLILMGGNFPDIRGKTFESTYNKSILLHEMIHEYTSYDSLWNGSVDNMSLKLSLINEGVALYYQFKFLIEEMKYLQLDKDDSIIEKIKLGILEAASHREQVLELLSDQMFTDLNRQSTESWNPSYFLGASLYNYFTQKLGFEDTRKIYSHAGNLKSDIAEQYLEEYFDKEEYLSSSREYLDDILAKLSIPQASA